MQNQSSRRLLLLLVAAIAVFAARAGQSRAAPQGSPPAAEGQAAPQKTPAAPAQAPARTGPQKKTAQQGSSAVRAITRLIQVSVVATDSHGNPVPDLAREDFRVFDEGREQQVSFFSVDSPGVRPAAGVPLPPGTWTNRFDRRGPVPISVTIILLDGLNTRAWEQAIAREQVIRALSTIQPSERVALYTLGAELRIIHDFTRDASSLLATLAQYKGYTGPAVAETKRLEDPSRSLEKIYNGDQGTEDRGGRELARFIEGADAAEAAMVNTSHALRTIDALEAIAAHAASIPGRKSLVWVSGGFPVSIGYDGLPETGRGLGARDRDFRDDIERATRALDDANMAVYPVSATGVAGSISSSFSPPNYLPGQSSYSIRPPIRLGTAQEHAIDTMIAFADRTGGRAFYGSNDLVSAIHAAQQDSRLVYTLAYSPSHARWDGTFRRIKVETRRPGVHLRFRQGYFAVPDRPLDERQRQQITAQAQWSPFVATEIVLTVNARNTVRDGNPALALTVTADASDLRLDVKDGRHSTDLILVACQKASDGGIVDDKAILLQARMTDETYRKVLEEGLRVDFTALLNNSATSMRIVLLDATDGRLGSVDVPLTDPNALPESPPEPKPQAKP